MEMRRHAGHAARENFAALGDELLEQVWILEVDGLERGVNAPTGHRTVVAAEIGAALRSLGLHGWKAPGLLGFAVQRVALEVRVVFLFFEPVRCVEALL